MCSVPQGKFLEVELLGHRLFVFIIFIKTINLFFYLSKTEYGYSLQFLLSDGKMYFPSVSITFLVVSCEVTSHWYFFSYLPIHVLYLFSIELLDFLFIGPHYIL